MGGMQALEWAIMYPERVASIIPVCACTEATAQQIAWTAIGRRAIRLDPGWRGGDYYDAAPGEGPHEGLAIARQIAQVTFRSDEVFTDRFGRSLADADHRAARPVAALRGRALPRLPRRQAGAPLRRQLATSLLGKAMDLHDVARGRGSRDRRPGPHQGARPVDRRVERPALPVVPAAPDGRAGQRRRRARPRYAEIDSPHGHDAFLIDVDQVGDAIAKFLAEVET